MSDRRFEGEGGIRVGLLPMLLLSQESSKIFPPLKTAVIIIKVCFNVVHVYGEIVVILLYKKNLSVCLVCMCIKVANRSQVFLFGI